MKRHLKKKRLKTLNSLKAYHNCFKQAGAWPLNSYDHPVEGFQSETLKFVGALRDLVTLQNKLGDSSMGAVTGYVVNFPPG